MLVDKPINFYSTIKDINIWQGYDFILPYFNQYEYELTVGSDFTDNLIIPEHIKESENKFIRYAPFDWSNGYFTITFKESLHSDNILFTESTELAVFAENCGRYDTDSILNKNGLQGKFAVIAKEIIAGSFEQMDKKDTFVYLLAYLPRCITNSFNFNSAYYSFSFTVKNTENVYTLFNGSVRIIKQGEIL